MHHLSIPDSLLQSADDDDDDSSTDSSHSTPRSSLFLFPGPPRIQYSDDTRRRPLSLASIDSGYFSSMSKDSPPSKSFLRKASGQDLRIPLFPISNATDATQASPRREGVIRSLLRKKKKSTSFPSPPDLDSFAIGLLDSVPGDDYVQQAQPVPFPLPPTRSHSRDPSIDAFEIRDHFVVRRGMKHHPYSHADAAYMLAYDRTLLDNDKFSEILLRRLSHNQTPSFHTFTHAPPKTILDLGCGTGGWAVEAAEFWPSSQVIGFDLLDPARLRSGAEAPSNVQWKQGNFVKYKLPFPKNMFDLVRMANLSFCVPFERWEHVMSEARRVLAQGGRLELIDDHLYFPYTKRPPQPSSDSHVSYMQPSSSSFDDDEDDEEIKEDSDAEQPAEDGDDADDGDNDDDDFVSTKSRFSSILDSDDFLPYDPVAEWDRNVDSAKSLEKLFEDMLSRKFSIHPRPSNFLTSVVDKVFGRYNQCRLHEFNLYLAPPPSDSGDSSIGSAETQGSASLKKAGKDFAKWVTAVDWDHYKEKDKRQQAKADRSSGESFSSLSAVPDIVSAKAAVRLGIKPTSSQSSHSHTTQSPGLILWPTTFIPIPPFELEMHACKHLHSLIGCKAALAEYIQDVAREQQVPFEEQMVDDLIWDYESFRRKRFNWPSECPDANLDEEAPVTATTTPRSNTFRNSIEASHPSRPGSGSMSAPPDPLFPREKLDFVRCIRVYSATKVDEECHFS